MSKLNFLLHKLSRWGAVGVIVTSVLGLLGYLPGLKLLASFGEAFIPMAPSTAICFILLAGILIVLNKNTTPPTHQNILISLAILVTLFAGLEVLSFITGFDLSFEDWLVPDLGMMGAIPVGRMSVSTGTLFLVSGLAIIGMVFSKNESNRASYLEPLSGVLASSVFIAGGIFLGAYLVGRPLLYNEPNTIPMALTTAISFLFLGTTMITEFGENGIVMKCLRIPFKGDKPFSGRRRFVLMVGVLISVAIINIAILVSALYRHNFRQTQDHLLASVQQQLQLMETINEYNISQAEMIKDEDPDFDPYQATLREFTTAHVNISDLGQSVEYTLAQLRGDSIVFLYTQKYDEAKILPSIHIKSDLAEPQRRALAGKSGVIIGKDYHGQEVIAAYGFQKTLNLGVVVKIDIAEIKAPFIRATLVGISVSGIFIVLGSILFIWIGSPVLNQLRNHNTILQSEIKERKAAETAVERTLDTLNESQRIAKLGSWYLDLATNEVAWTEELYRMYGFDPSVPPPPYTEHKRLFTEESWEKLSAALSKTAEEGIPYDLELETVREDGTNGWMWVHGESLKNSDGVIFALRGAAQDITERKQAEEKIKKTELLLRSSLEGLKDTIFFSIDKNYRYLFFNIAHKDAMKSGYNKDIAIGMNALDCITSDDDRQAAKENYDRTLAGETHSNIRKYGNEVVSYFESYFNPILNDNDEVIGVTALARDITDRKQIEEALRASEDRLQLINNATLDQIYSYDLDNRFTSANRQLCAMLNLSPDEIIGKSYWELGFPETQCREWDELHRRVYKTGSQTEIVSTPMPDGMVHYFEVNLSVIRDYDGAIVGIAGVNRDITERKQAEQERRSLEAKLHQAQKLEAIGTMVGGISHEFNNLLQNMFLYAGLVQDSLPDDQELRANFQQILDSGNRARDLIKQVLTFSRKTKVEMKPQPLHDMIIEVLEIEQVSLPANIDIQQDIDLNCGSVLCDKTQIHQVMVNLCNNARHAMEEKGGALTVSLKPTQASLNNGDPETDVVELKVSDTGHGIDTPDLEKIFDPFFTNKQFGHGTGLGLSVIHGIVEMMDGHISVTSELSKGTTFRILFPVAEAVEEGEIAKSSAVPKLMSRSILLVDDEHSIREAVKTILSNIGFDVDSAPDGHEALELFKANPGKYDLVVTDLSMPKMSGVELTKAIRNTSSDIPIILSTGHLGIEEERGLKDIGITAFIQKPWTAQEMIERIQELDDI